MHTYTSKPFGQRLLSAITLIAMVLGMTTFASPQTASAAPTQDWDINNLSDTTYTEGGPPIIVAGDVTFHSDTHYTDGYLLFDITNSTAYDQLVLTSAAVPTATGAISVDGLDVYLGNGTGRDRVGSIDATQNGQNGQPLLIRFASPLENYSFENGTTGWDLFQQEFNASSPTYNQSLDGTPIDYYTGGAYTGPATIILGVNDSVTFNISTTTDRASHGSHSLKLTSLGWLVRSGGAGSDTIDGNLSLHGPYAASSNPFRAFAGDSITLDWMAIGGNDDYEVFGYLVNSSGAYSELFRQRGDVMTTWKEESVVIATEDDYRFLFVGGTYDKTGGYLVGADLYVDNIRLLSTTRVTDTAMSAIAQQITFANTSNNPNTTTRILEVSAQAHDGTSGEADANITIIAIPSPAAPEITTPITGTVLSNPTPTFSGTAEVGTTVVTVTLEPSGPVICAAAVNPDGTWACPAADPLPNGEYTFTAVGANAAGKVSDPSDPVTVTIEAVAEIDVSVTELTATQPPDVITTQTFEICNNGTLPLTYTINAGSLVGPLMAQYQPFGIAAPAADQTLTGSAVDGNLQITVRDTGTMGVWRYVSGVWQSQIYGTWAKGSRLQFSGGAYTLSKQSTWVMNGTDPTTVSNSTSGNTITTVWNAGSDFQITQKTTYIDGNSYYRMEWDITNTSGASITDLRFFHGEDTYLQGGDNGAGWWDAVNTTVGVQKDVGGILQRMYLQGITTPYGYDSIHYATARNNANAGALSNTVNPDPNHDNGYALEWREALLAAGDTWKIVVFERFTSGAAGSVYVIAPISVDCTVGVPCDVTYQVSNPSGSPVEVNLAVSSDQPTWNAVITSPTSPATVPANGSINVVVQVTVPAGTPDGTMGDFTLTATPTAGGDAGSDTAAIQAVGGGAPTPITVDPTGGTVAPGTCDTITVTFDSTGLAEGVYTGDLVIDSNDPDSPTTIPVTLTVTAVAPLTVIAPISGTITSDIPTFAGTGEPGYEVNALT